LPALKGTLNGGFSRQHIRQPSPTAFRHRSRIEGSRKGYLCHASGIYVVFRACADQLMSCITEVIRAGYVLVDESKSTCPISRLLGQVTRSGWRRSIQITPWKRCGRAALCPAPTRAPHQRRVVIGTLKGNPRLASELLPSTGGDSLGRITAFRACDRVLLLGFH
jgi:hypothetical protein